MQLPRVRPTSSREAAEPQPTTTSQKPQLQDETTPSSSARTSTDSTDLRNPRNFQHIAVFADALFRSLPVDLGLRGFDGISAALEQSIKNHSFTVACDGKEDPLTEATCRRLGYLMYRHRRQIIAILRQRYIDADTGSQIGSLLQRVTLNQREDSGIERGNETEPNDDEASSTPPVAQDKV
ncbi:hypothetical protein PG984_013882 [Apiospora sp. TS-2023a]